MTEEAVEHHGSELRGIPRRPGRSTHAWHGRSSQRSCKACGMTRLPSGYNEKYRICKACYQAPQLSVGGEGGQLMRFCQQCSKLQLLDEFDGDRRSCRHALERHASRRQNRQSRVARSPSPQPQPRPARRPRLEPAQQEEQQQQEQEQQEEQEEEEQQQPQEKRLKRQATPPAAAIHMVPAPAAEVEPAQLWPAELLQLAQLEQQERQRREGQPQQLGGELGPGSLSLVVGHPTERMEITISLEPWLQSQPAPCPDGSSAGEPASAAREAWQMSLASLPSVRTSPFQQAGAAVPATTHCSSQSAATVGAAATTMAAVLPLAVPSSGAATVLVPAGSGSGCLSAVAYATPGSATATDTPFHTPFAASPSGHAIELTGSNSLRLSARLPLLSAATPGPQAHLPTLGPAPSVTPAQAAAPQQLGWPGTLSSPLAAGHPPGIFGPRGSSNWGGWL